MGALRRKLRAVVHGDADKVLAGSDGWLFLQNDTNDVIGQHTGRVRMGRRRLAAWERLLHERMSTVEAFGARWLCLIAPDKEAVYPEHLPSRIRPAARRPVLELLDVAARLGAPLLYPLDDLRAAKGAAPLYYQTDTHWNQLGCYVAYRLICQELGVAPVDETSIDWVEETVVGDLGEKLEPPIGGASVRAELRRHKSRLVADNGVANHGRVMVFESDADAEGPVCVAFGESFGNHLLIFLKESFRRLVYVHTSALDAERIRHERPDVVLSLPVERFLIEVPDDRDAAARLEGLARRKLAAGQLGSQRFLRGIPRAEQP